MWEKGKGGERGESCEEGVGHGDEMTQMVANLLVERKSG